MWFYSEFIDKLGIYAMFMRLNWMVAFIISIRDGARANRETAARPTRK
jgi:hypothetical protein